MKKLAIILSVIMTLSVFGAVPGSKNTVQAEEITTIENVDLDAQNDAEDGDSEQKRMPVKLLLKDQSGNLISDTSVMLKLGQEAYPIIGYLCYEITGSETGSSFEEEIVEDGLTYSVTQGTDVVGVDKGLVTAKNTGVAQITVSYPVNDTEKLTADVTIEVTNPPVSLSMQPTSVSIKVGDTQKLQAVYNYYNGQTQPASDVSYVSSDPQTVEVDANTGVIKGLKTGKNIEISAMTKDGLMTARCLVTVTAVSVQGITLNATSVNTLSIGDTFQLSATVTPANATNQKVTYSIVDSKPLKSTVSTTVIKVGKSTGLVTVSGLGTAVVEAKSADGAFTARCTFTVYQTYFDVTKLGANGKDSANDNTAINKALKWAVAVNEPITVYVPAGTYYIGARLYIYSDTKLVLDKKAVIIRQASAAGRPMLQSLYKTSATKGYTQIQNVEISGGVWDGNANGKDYTDNFYLGHGKNIYIHDTTIKNNSGSHLIELVGIKNAVIENVNLQGFKICTKSGYGVALQTVKEAIQLDYCSKASASAMTPYDYTVCNTITVRNCTISNYMCGIGAHGYKAGVYLKNILIENNTFKNITNCCIDLRNFKNVTVRNNTAKGFNTFLYGYNSTGVIKNNNLTNKSFTPLTTKYRMFANGIYLSTKSQFTISNNTIKNCGNHGISIASNSKVTIKNNTIKNNKKYGIKVEGATATIKGNKVSGNKYSRQYYSDAKAKITADNIQAYNVALNSQYLYTGKALKPKITISGLKKGKHYTVTYKKNKSVGTAQVTIKGKGTKKGKLVLNFSIVKKIKK